MESNFGPDFFIENRKRLKTLFTGTAPIVITAAGLSQRSGDVTFPFRQDSNFWYLTGIETPDVILVMDKEREYLILPHREVVNEQFDGAIDAEMLMKRSGIETVLGEKEGWKLLASRLKRTKHVATLASSPAYEEFHHFFTHRARARLVRRIKAHNETIKVLDLRNHLMKMRMFKQPAELQAIKAAIDITAATIQDTVRDGFAGYEYEYEVDAAIQYGFGKRGSREAFESITASGERAATIHSLSKRHLLAQNSFIILDVGAEVENYAADISRTYPVGVISRRQERVFEAVYEVQQFALDQLRPGLTIRDCEKNIEHLMGEKLRELGLIKVIDHDSVREYYPHAASHFLGLDTHDVGDYDMPLEPGMVITVEPGIYIPQEAIGVRIEDDVLITESGIQNLTEYLPRDPR